MQMASCVAMQSSRGAQIICSGDRGIQDIFNSWFFSLSLTLAADYVALPMKRKSDGILSPCQQQICLNR